MTFSERIEAVREFLEGTEPTVQNFELPSAQAELRMLDSHFIIVTNSKLSERVRMPYLERLEYVINNLSN